VAPAAPAAAVAAAAAAAATHITLRSTGEAWMRIADRNGGTVANRLLHAGDTMDVPATAAGQRLYLTTGNAGATQVLIDGELAPSLGKDGVVLRRVPLDPSVLRQGGAALAAPSPTPAPAMHP
jgi:cytoskeleton protein RodZ